MGCREARLREAGIRCVLGEDAVMAIKGYSKPLNHDALEAQETVAAFIFAFVAGLVALVVVTMWLLSLRV